MPGLIFVFLFLRELPEKYSPTLNQHQNESNHQVKKGPISEEAFQYDGKARLYFLHEIFRFIHKFSLFFE